MQVAKKIYFPILFVLVVWASYVITVNAGSPNPRSYIKTEVAPSGSAITIDGHKVGVGNIPVRPGGHKLVASRKGFASRSQSVSVGINQAIYVGLVLQPSSAETGNWYNQHPLDQRLADGIASHTADYQQGVAFKAMPFIKQLPTEYGDGYGNLIDVAPGASIPPASLPAVYVTALTSGDRQSVIAYVKSRGFDPADMDMVFYGLQSPLQNQKAQIGGGD